MADSRVQYWISSIHAKVGTNAPILLVGTHLDDPEVANVDLEKVKSNALSKLGKTVKHVAFVSCLNGNIHPLPFFSASFICEVKKSIMTNQLCR